MPATVISMVLSGGEAAVFGDSAYSKMANKQKARKEGIYYGMLDKAQVAKGYLPHKRNGTKKIEGECS